MAGYLAPILFRIKNRVRFCNANDVIENVRQNVETILNSRLMIPADYILRPTDKESLTLLDDSLINFGVVDFQSMNMGDTSMEKRFCNSVRIALERYEPRLAKVKIEMIASAKDRLVSIQVNGQLAVQPFEDIRFESGLDTESQKFIVS
ncbi:MAG: type VI secretion system baseplate subunit TssE [Mariniblastus sp.]